MCMSRKTRFGALVAILLAAAPAAEPPRSLGDEIGSPRPRVPVLSNDEAWRFLPKAQAGSGQPLPSWARALARSLPRTTAALLDLDRIDRTRSPLGPILRGKMR